MQIQIQIQMLVQIQIQMLVQIQIQMLVQVLKYPSASPQVGCLVARARNASYVVLMKRPRFEKPGSLTPPPR